MKILSKRALAKLSFDPNARTPQQLHELAACTADPVHFINAHVKIKHLVRGHVDLVLHPYQVEYVRTLNSGGSVVAVLPRGAGTTTASVAFYLWAALFGNHQAIVLLGVNPRLLMDLLHTMATHLPTFMVPGARFARDSVSFGNGSSILVQPLTTPPLGRKVHRAYADGFASASPGLQSTSWSALMFPSPISPSIVIASTPNGRGNIFERLWIEAGAGRTLFIPFKRTIEDLPQFDATWRMMMRKAIGESAWQRDFMCEFV